MENREKRSVSIVGFLNLVWCAALVFSSCSDAGLQPILEDVTYVDDKLSLTGEFCTGPADDVAFPVKILIVVDQSASLQCTDPGNNRLTALNSAGSALDSLPNVEFGVIGFASWSRIVDFTPDWNQVRDTLAPEAGQGGPATDYQGSLSVVLRVLEQDMVESGPAACARTKYIVLFLSDGSPVPNCVSGCDDADIHGVCNTIEDIPEDVYVDMYGLCPDYNQPEQIAQKVQDIMSLGDLYGVGDLTLNTIFLFAPESEISAVCGDISVYGYDREKADPLMRSMAKEGLGTFRDVNMSTEIDFLEFDYESLKTPYHVAEFFAINMNTIPIETGFGVDSDRDGIDDTIEFEKGLNRLSGDSDGDGYGDLFELIFESKGFDPLDSEVPAIGCAGNLDRDADGLKECEENFLGTDPGLVDSDGDRLPDGIEVRLGIDPTSHDTLVDHDFDGRLSGAEVRTGTSPRLVDEENTLLNQVLYSINAGPIKDDEVRCYDFSIQGLTLVPSLNLPDEQKGKGTNRILIFAQEEPINTAGDRGRFYVACVEARYLGETYKDPPSGQVQGISPLRFVEVQLFEPALHCIRPGDNPAAGPSGEAP